jgi:hypothetical protein
MPSLESGLRVIRRARIRAWLLAIGLVPICITTSLLLPEHWVSVLPLPGRGAVGLVTYWVILGLYLMHVGDLPCPRCGKPFFGMYPQRRTIFFVFFNRCWYCQLHL